MRFAKEDLRDSAPASIGAALKRDK
jgi:hypothetical protein